jgi:hypothetical protein
MGTEWMVDQPSPGEQMFSGEVYLALSPQRMHVLPDGGVPEPATPRP